ncbi:ATP-binding cassette domain-containing protein, partial [Bacteroidota bacterium]
MTENIIEAIIKLFAIITNKHEETLSGNGKQLVKAFLDDTLDAKSTEKYLGLYNHLLHSYSKEFTGKSAEKNGEQKNKILEICKNITAEHELFERILIIIQLLEFIKKENIYTDEELEYVDIVSKNLNINLDEYQDIKSFILYDIKKVQSKEQLCVVDGNETIDNEDIKHIFNKNQIITIEVFHIRSKNILIFKYFGERNLYLNGLKIQSNRTYLLAPGSVLKTSRIRPVYYSRILAEFHKHEGHQKIIYCANNIEFKFDKKTIGVHKFNLIEESGQMVGIIGGSGSGKSTLLNVLNGNLPLHRGKITLNGYDLEENKEDVQGLIGFVPQDDFLIEDLTVYENLYFSAKLCLDNLPEEELVQNIVKVLIDFDLHDVKDLKVGSPLKKIISGGQRKRLNVALELIREPLVLFIDEPTSGLSSMDSEKMMSLLKRQTYKGKLVFTVIHQPSSDIYKLFDRIIIIDKGGYIIFNGNPIDAITYFKTEAHFINAEESECLSCGNIKTEQPLRIIEARKVNPYGRFLKERRINPEEWYKIYINTSDIKKHHRIEKHLERKRKLPQTNFQIPGKIKQFIIYTLRDVKAKLTNTQYILITLLEAPLLALILGIFTRYNAGTNDNPNKYIFSENDNILVYIFMSVLVALFLGLIQSADEIFKDKKILKRESFLNLSKFSFLNSKVFILFSLSAFQMLIYTIIGNVILGIKGMTFHYWLILFSTACFANVLGLNISATLKSAISIYILIPLLLIPQILFSGAVVDFKKMPSFGNPNYYSPVIGDIMTSRWAFEAITVHQYKKNKYNKEIFPVEMERQQYIFKNSYLIPELKRDINYFNDSFPEYIYNELETLNPMDNFQYSSLEKKDILISKLDSIEKILKNKISISNKLKEETINLLILKYGGKENVIKLKEKYHNNQLAEKLEDIY